MDLTSDAQPVVRRAVAAYETKKGYEGPFRGITADEILEELKPSPVRWAELAAFVIETADGHTRESITSRAGPSGGSTHWPRSIHKATRANRA